MQVTSGISGVVCLKTLTDIQNLVGDRGLVTVHENTFYLWHFTGSNYDDHTYMNYESKRKLLKVRFMFVVLHFLLPY